MVLGRLLRNTPFRWQDGSVMHLGDLPSRKTIAVEKNLTVQKRRERCCAELRAEILQQLPVFLGFLGVVATHSHGGFRRTCRGELSPLWCTSGSWLRQSCYDRNGNAT